MKAITPRLSTKSNSWWLALLFATSILIIGLIPGALTFALDPNAATRIGLGVTPIPASVFSSVWLIAYPGMGIATWLVWRRRDHADVSIPLAIFGGAFLQTLSFWLTNSLRMTAVVDATGVLLAYTVAWVYWRYRPATLWWLLPWLTWMPITLGIKLWALWNGGH